MSKQSLELPALLRLIPKFPLFPATVDDKALENSSQEPEAQSSLILSLIREPFLKLKHTNIPYAFSKMFSSRFLEKFVFLLNIGVYCISWIQLGKLKYTIISSLWKEMQREKTRQERKQTLQDVLRNAAQRCWYTSFQRASLDPALQTMLNPGYLWTELSPLPD